MSPWKLPTCKMFLGQNKLVVCVLFIVGCSTVVTRALYSRTSEDGKEYGDINLPSEIWSDRRKEQPLLVDTKEHDSVPYINLITGNSKEWSNMEHSRQSKRSEDLLAQPIPNPPIANDLTALNLSNPISKYHCPINLLYGNNLTVKNYFLLMPRNNASSNFPVETPEEEEAPQEKFSPKLLTETNSNEATTAIHASDGMDESSTQQTSPTESSTNQEELISTTIESSLEPQYSTNPTEFSVSATQDFNTSKSELTVSGENLVKTDELSTPSESTGVPETTAEGTVTTGVSDEINLDWTTVSEPETTVTEISNFTGIKNETIGSNAPGDTTVSEPENTVTEISNFTTIKNETIGTNAAGDTSAVTKPTVDVRNDVMRTIDKYCETFNMSEAGMYTLFPASLGKAPPFHSFQDDKSKIKQQLVGDKRTILKRNLRKHFNPL
ncbi:uncharacterized protein LOC124360128 [Homalodisca vitripennis]|uniref:uncharacterized protein LOC124360128 n=1 Tax=Homalodisca vitripennis TaxID=197043 RepID=UPI001EEAB11F|nr:uncharacterized protein LOC124360128 [Homalodisca vitripennis]